MSKDFDRNLVLFIKGHFNKVRTKPRGEYEGLMDDLTTMYSNRCALYRKFIKPETIISWMMKIADDLCDKKNYMDMWGAMSGSSYYFYTDFDTLNKKAFWFAWTKLGSLAVKEENEQGELVTVLELGEPDLTVLTEKYKENE